MVMKSGFFEAALYGWVDSIAKSLKKKPEWIHLKNDAGNTVLHVAAAHGHTDVIRLLIEKGAKIDEAGSQGETSFFKAIKNRRYATACAFLESGADISRGDPLLYAVEQGELEYVKIILAAKPGLARTDLLQLALAQKHTDIAVELLTSGVSPHDRDRSGNYPIHGAAAYGHMPVLDIFLAAKVDIDVLNADGDTPLHLAIRSKHADLAIALVKHGARTDITGQNGETTADMARRMNLYIITQAMEERDAPPLAPATPEESETWVRMSKDKVAHVGIYPALGRKLTEIFNFENRERLTIVENLKTGAENTTPPESFDNLPEEIVVKALRSFKALDPTISIEESSLFQKRISKQLPER